MTVRGPVNAPSWPHKASSSPIHHGSTEADKLRQIRNQLVILVHAHHCGRSTADGQAAHADCSLRHCSTMKSVLGHMKVCSLGRACPVPHCASSRRIIAHWKHCAHGEDCPLCGPLKRGPPASFREVTAFQETEAPADPHP